MPFIDFNAVPQFVGEAQNLFCYGWRVHQGSPNTAWRNAAGRLDHFEDLSVAASDLVFFDQRGTRHILILTLTFCRIDWGATRQEAFADQTNGLASLIQDGGGGNPHKFGLTPGPTANSSGPSSRSMICMAGNNSSTRCPSGSLM